MLKLSLWIGIPALVAYLSSLFATVVVENILLFLGLSLIAIVVAIAPRLAGDKIKK